MFHIQTALVFLFKYKFGSENNKQDLYALWAVRSVTVILTSVVHNWSCTVTDDFELKRNNVLRCFAGEHIILENLRKTNRLCLLYMKIANLKYISC